MNVIRINIYQKEFRVKKDGTAPVVIRVNMNKDRVEIPTGVNIPIAKWDQDKEKARGNSLESIEANSILESFRSKIMGYYQKNIDNSGLTANKIKDYATGKTKDGIGIIELFDIHNAQMKAQIDNGTGYTKGTLTKFKTIRNHVLRFIGEDRPVSEFTYNDIDDFHNYLKSDRGISQNVTVKYIENLGKIFRIALRKGYILKDPTAPYNEREEDSDTTYLTEAELHRLETTDMGTDALDRYRDFFVFSCYTALAYSDIKKLTMDQIFSRDGEWILVYRRKKSKKQSTLLLFDEALAIIEKYEPFREVDGSGRTFPVPSNQQYNVHLKDVAVKAKIPASKKLTTHVARHTFATTVALGKDMNLKMVSSAMGHSTIKQTERYAKVIDTGVIDSMKRVREKLRSTDGSGKST